MVSRTLATIIALIAIESTVVLVSAGMQQTDTRVTANADGSLVTDLLPGSGDQVGPALEGGADGPENEEKDEEEEEKPVILQLASSAESEKDLGGSVEGEKDEAETGALAEEELEGGASDTSGQEVAEVQGLQSMLMRRGESFDKVNSDRPPTSIISCGIFRGMTSFTCPDGTKANWRHKCRCSWQDIEFEVTNSACCKSCCRPTTCSLFSCPKGSGLKEPIPSSCTDATGDFCTKAKCCQSDCSDFKNCTSGFRPIIPYPTCANGRCGTDECCEPLCQRSDCPPGYDFIIPARPCADKSCDVEGCCKKSCTNFTCPTTSRRLTNPPSCATMKCDENDCCEKTTTTTTTFCDPVFGCIAGTCHVFILDKSKSMADKVPAELAVNGYMPTLDTLAMDHLSSVINNLPENHNFDVILYSHDAWAWKDQPVVASRGNKAEAIAYARGRQPYGVTNSASALAKAFSVAETGCMDRMYFLSDGKPTLGIPCTEILDNIEDLWTHKAPKKVPINAIAFGDLAINGLLLQMQGSSNDSSFVRKNREHGEVVTEDTEIAFGDLANDALLQLKGSSNYSSIMREVQGDGEVGTEYVEMANDVVMEDYVKRRAAPYYDYGPDYWVDGVPPGFNPGRSCELGLKYGYKPFMEAIADITGGKFLPQGGGPAPSPSL